MGINERLGLWFEPWEGRVGLDISLYIILVPNGLPHLIGWYKQAISKLFNHYFNLQNSLRSLKNTKFTDLIFL